MLYYYNIFFIILDEIIYHFSFLLQSSTRSFIFKNNVL